MLDDQECLLNIDWLGLSLRIQHNPKPIKGYKWKEYTATNVWGKRWVLWTEDGDRVCTLLAEPRSSILDAKSALLEIENEWLYHGTGPEGILQRLLPSINFEILGISRLDLCVDFVPTEEQKDIILGLASGKYYVGGKRSGSGFWSTNTAKCLHPDWLGKKIPHSQSWGHKTSDIKWKLYYKTRELWEAGGWKFPHKPYIIDQWRMFGLDTSNVWRLEVSCKHLNNLQLYGQTMDLGLLARERVSFWLSLYLQRFQIKKDLSHKDRTNDPIIDFLPMPNEGKNITLAPAKSLAEHSGRITLLRHLVQSLDDEHVYLDEPTRMTVFQAIYDIVNRDHLDNYFRVMTGRWLDDFIAVKDREAVEEYDSIGAAVSQMNEREGDAGASQRLYDMPDWRQKYQSVPNLAFEDNMGSSAQMGESEQLKKDKAEMKATIDKMSESIRRAHYDPQIRIKFLPPDDPS